MNNLLEKIKIINFKYDTLKADNQFNVFKILRKHDDEVNLHSKFLSELLNPNGTHGCSDLFLNLFLKVLGNNSNSFSKNTKVYSEINIGPINFDKTKGGQIDILIENTNGKSIIIENKIHASDQENQLLRYRNYSKEAQIYYLTLDGSEPSSFSLGNLELEEIKYLSYKVEIRKWIELCIQRTSLKPTIRETLSQYLQLINELIGETSIMEERLELIELLSKNNNILPASKIAENWVHVRWHTEFDFWSEFEEIIKKNSEYKISDIQKYSVNTINSVIHKSRGKYPWYGLLFNILTFENVNYSIFIERGERNVYYGLLMLDENNNRIDNNNPIHNYLTKALNKNVEFNNEIWLGVKYLEPKINFQLFNQQNTLKLVNIKNRLNYINSNWKEIEKFIGICINEIKNYYLSI